MSELQLVTKSTFTNTNDSKSWDTINGAVALAKEIGDIEPLMQQSVLAAIMELTNETARKQAEEILVQASKIKNGATAMRAVFNANRLDYANKIRSMEAHAMEISSFPKGVDKQLLIKNFAVDDNGILHTDINDKGEETTTIVSHYPIIPIEYQKDIDDNTRKVELAYYSSGEWKHLTVDSAILATRQGITALAAYDNLVTSETAGYLVKYFSECEAYNKETIPEIQSVCRMGWSAPREYVPNIAAMADEPYTPNSRTPHTNPGEFAPYSKSLKFNGDSASKEVYDALKTKGDYYEWLQCILDIRASKSLSRFHLAASFAAPLVGLLGGLCSFVHLWGDSGIAKTVTLAVAASVWGNPKPGELVRTFNSTLVGMEHIAGFLQNIPVCLNELQTVKKDADTDETIYMLVEGQGKTRGAKNGGTRKQQRWQTIFLSNGEQSITSDRSGAGAINRVLSINCGAESLYENPRETMDTVLENYGHAGLKFIEYLQSMTIERLKSLYDDAVQRIIKCSKNSTSKQIEGAAFGLLADELANDCLFEDDNSLTPEDYAKVLASADDISNSKRSIDWVRGWISANEHHFLSDNIVQINGRMTIETWGKWQSVDTIAINPEILKEHIAKAKFNYNAFLSHANAAGILVKGNDGSLTRQVKIGKVNQRYVVLCFTEQTQTSI